MQDKSVVEKLGEKEFHDTILQKLKDRLEMSERAMTNFYARWRVNEKKVQAYIDLPKYEKVLKEMNDSGEPPAAVSITVPYSFATIWTIVTYMIHTFCGRSPIFQVAGYSDASMDSAAYMETMMQFNCDRTRMVDVLLQWFTDAELYGVGAVRCLWKEKYRKRSVWTAQSMAGSLSPDNMTKKVRQRQRVKVYEGNDVVNIDPFMFFPDPRVPMKTVSEKGEFVFWRDYQSKHDLKSAEIDGGLFYVDKITTEQPANQYAGAGEGSNRNLISKGEAHPGDPRNKDSKAEAFVQIDQGTVTLIPSQWGLSEENKPEKWLFSIANKSQIIQAEPLDLDHDLHPVIAIEPMSFGYGFGQPGTADFLGPIQDALSWFMNSHIYNVRAALNNMFVVDPSMVEMQDLKNPGPGKLIRLKRTAYGQDVRSAITQLSVQDITRSHITDMQLFMRLGDSLAAVNDNLRGIQDAGGRKTATEVRTSSEAGASRLAARARSISAHGMCPLAEQMSLNLQQNLSMEFYLKVVGPEGMKAPIPITPEMLGGEFYYPVHDGTLPLDRVALLDVWKEIWLAISSNPLLMQRYDSLAIFEYVAELGGAKNLSGFKVTAAPDEQVQRQAEAGNAAPIPQG